MKYLAIILLLAGSVQAQTPDLWPPDTSHRNSGVDLTLAVKDKTLYRAWTGDSSVVLTTLAIKATKGSGGSKTIKVALYENTNDTMVASVTLTIDQAGWYVYADSSLNVPLEAGHYYYMAVGNESSDGVELNAGYDIQEETVLGWMCSEEPLLQDTWVCPVDAFYYDILFILKAEYTYVAPPPPSDASRRRKLLIGEYNETILGNRFARLYPVTF